MTILRTEQVRYASTARLSWPEPSMLLSVICAPPIRRRRLGMQPCRHIDFISPHMQFQ